MKPAYEELEQIVQEQAKEIRNLRAEVERLMARFGKNSKNSSKPPSLDPKPNTPPKKREGQAAHHAGAKFVDCTGWRHMGKNHHALILRTPSLIRLLA